VKKKETFSVQFIVIVSAVSDRKKAVDGKEQTVYTTLMFIGPCIIVMTEE